MTRGRELITCSWDKTINERMEFERYVLSIGYNEIDATYEDGQYDNPVIQQFWNVWQARADLATERERELVEALRFVQDHDFGWAKRIDVAGILELRKVVSDALAKHEQENQDEM